MLQNYKEQKHVIQQKHIEILQKKKDEASLIKQRKNNEIIKIKHMHHFLEHFHLKLQY
jgi:hypothetical protein